MSRHLQGGRSAADLHVNPGPGTAQPCDPGEAAQPSGALFRFLPGRWHLGDGDGATCNAATETKQDPALEALISVPTQ